MEAAATRLKQRANERIASTARGLEFEDERPLPFLCECPRRCTEVVLLSLADRASLAKEGRLLLRPGHEDPGIATSREAARTDW